MCALISEGIKLRWELALLSSVQREKRQKSSGAYWNQWITSKLYNTPDVSPAVHLSWKESNQPNETRLVCVMWWWSRTPVQQAAGHKVKVMSAEKTSSHRSLFTPQIPHAIFRMKGRAYCLLTAPTIGSYLHLSLSWWHKFMVSERYQIISWVISESLC